MHAERNVCREWGDDESFDSEYAGGDEKKR